MKFIICLLISLFISSDVFADDRISVEFSKCVDGDTAYFHVDGVEKKFRFLGVDTPETVHPTKGEEIGGKSASEFTCNELMNASVIEVMYDPSSDKKDKYDRELVWVYVDNVLLQKKLVREGYAEVAYVYGDYLNVMDLCKEQKKAIRDDLGIWYDSYRVEGFCSQYQEGGIEDSMSTLYIVFGIVCTILFCLTLYFEYKKKI